MFAEVSAGLLGGLLALGAWERVQRDRAHAAIPTRVHVNGTRGKSTVTRLIAAALRASGCPTIAKTTGTAARLIHTDGGEVPVVRRSSPSIREQLWLLREARRLGARAIVVECMAIDPSLQEVSERDMVKATIGVITNARPDHADVMGTTADTVARALARTVPAGGLIVLGPTLPAQVFTDAARCLGTRVVQARREDAARLATRTVPAWSLDNLAVALEVTRALGIADSVAWPAMLAAPDDPGAVRVYTAWSAGHRLTIVDATAANDPDSLQLLLDDVALDGSPLFVFNHRADRPLRLRQFADAPVWKQPSVAVLVTGDTPDLASRRIVGRAIGPHRLGFAPARHLPRVLREQMAATAVTRPVVICGNTRQLDIAGLVAAISDADTRASHAASAGAGD